MDIENGRLIKAYKEDIVNGTLTIPEGVDTIESEACCRLKMDKVIIPETVKEIKDMAFLGCNKLEEIAIGENMEFLGNGSFAMCKSLDYVKLNEKVQLGRGAFSGCDKIIEIILPSTMETIPEGLFHGCESLEKISVPENVREIGAYAFENCKNLKEVVMGNNVKSYGERAFAGCESLNEIQNSEKLKYIGDDVFAGSGLKTFRMPNNDMELGYRVFSNCKQLESIELSSKLDEIPKHFLYKCSALESIQIPESVSKIEERAFAGSGLKELVSPSKIEGFDLSAVKGCKNLDGVSFPEGEVCVLQDAFTDEGSSYYTSAFDKLRENEDTLVNGIEWVAEMADKMDNQRQLESYKETQLIRNILKTDKFEKAYVSEESVEFPVKGQEGINII